MVNVAIVGCNGKMGYYVVQAVKNNSECNPMFGVDKFGDNKYDFPVYNSFSEIKEVPDVIIDFSNPSTIDDGMIDYAVKNSVACVICTTGHSQEQLDIIDSASEKIAVFRSGNMSLGINTLIELAKSATKVLGKEFDIEIVEKHHNLKIDAPSGTALMIADGIAETLDGEPQYVYDRYSYRKKRSDNEIGIHSVRGGTIVGEHEVIFAGHDEVITISHQAQSKEVFAVGSVNAAVFLADKKAGKYNMKDLLSSKLN